MGKKRAQPNVKQSTEKLNTSQNGENHDKTKKGKKRNHESETTKPSTLSLFVKYAAVGLILSAGVSFIICACGVDVASFGARMCYEANTVLIRIGLRADTTDAGTSHDIISNRVSKTYDPVDDKKPTRKNYSKVHITNSQDNTIHVELDEADTALEKDQVAEAIRKYDGILSQNPSSPRAVFGKANALNRQSEIQQSNEILEQAISEYSKILNMKDVPKQLFLMAGRKCAERQGFRGWAQRAAVTIRQMLAVYPEEVKLWNELGVQYMMAGKVEDARGAFKQVLLVKPDDGFAKVHIGFIMKTTDKDYKGAIPFLHEGIQTNDLGVNDGRFFFQLGDALFRTGRHNESYEVYKHGAEKGLFLSMWQRSLYNVNGLSSRPWWTKEQTGIAKALKVLESHWKTIRDEGLSNLDEKLGVFKLEEEDLRERGDWRQFTLFQQGRRNEENCRKAPKSCALIEQIPEATGCKRGQVKFSVMQPGVHVWPHCGPTNCRIRCHLGLVVPPGPQIRVGNETHTWKEGKFIVFDDSFEHEVWHDGDSVRLVLIMDVWHPELTAKQRASLSPI